MLNIAIKISRYKTAYYQIIVLWLCQSIFYNFRACSTNLSICGNIISDINIERADCGKHFQTCSGEGKFHEKD